jgi:hypothetical protein
MAQGQPGPAGVETDRSGKGAVLCAWGIYEAARAAGRACFDGQDGPFQAELERSISRIDQFILANSSRHITQAQLDERRRRGLEEVRQAGDICKGAAAQMYVALRTRGAAALGAGTDELLSVPREPVMNPCL